jgi:hypothetical protein
MWSILVEIQRLVGRISVIISPRSLHCTRNCSQTRSVQIIATHSFAWPLPTVRWIPLNEPGQSLKNLLRKEYFHSKQKTKKLTMFSKLHSQQGNKITHLYKWLKSTLTKQPGLFIVPAQYKCLYNLLLQLDKCLLASFTSELTYETISLLGN